MVLIAVLSLQPFLGYLAIVCLTKKHPVSRVSVPYFIFFPLLDIVRFFKAYNGCLMIPLMFCFDLCFFWKTFDIDVLFCVRICHLSIVFGEVLFKYLFNHFFGCFLLSCVMVSLHGLLSWI